MRPVRLVVHAVEDDAAVCALRVEHIVDSGLVIVFDLDRACVGVGTCAQRQRGKHEREARDERDCKNEGMT